MNFLNAEIIHKPENRWFVDELRRSLPPTRSDENRTDNSIIAKIEKYLALDYKLDDAKTVLDYSSIKDEYLRECFEADCREMLRFRYGLRGHRIDFGEFCRYAQMQAERLLNVYYRTKGSLPQICADIKKYNPDAKGLDNCKSLGSISYSVKLWAYKNEYSLESIAKIFDNVRKVRNARSHGSSHTVDEKFFDTHRAMLLKEGYPLRSDCTVDWYALSKDESKNKIYISTIKDTPKHKRYIDLCWQRRQPFDEVIMALEELIVHVSHHING